MSADLSTLRPLVSRRVLPIGPSEDDLAAARLAAQEAEARGIAHRLLSDRARRLLPGCTPEERAEVLRLIHAGPGSGLRAVVVHLELAGVRLAPESLCA